MLHLTGNMQRCIWGFDGKKFSESKPILVKLGERMRLRAHQRHHDGASDPPARVPVHAGERRAARCDPLKHTVNVKPDERLSFVFDADTPGHWAFHCHLLYHMQIGMFRTVLVA